MDTKFVTVWQGHKPRLTIWQGHKPRLTVWQGHKLSLQLSYTTDKRKADLWHGHTKTKLTTVSLKPILQEKKRFVNDFRQHTSEHRNKASHPPPPTPPLPILFQCLNMISNCSTIRIFIVLAQVYQEICHMVHCENPRINTNALTGQKDSNHRHQKLRGILYRARSCYYLHTYIITRRFTACSESD